MASLYLWLLILFTQETMSNSAVFLVPFEISFAHINPFSFTVYHLSNFMDSTSSFFDIDDNNITIAFVKEIAATRSIDIGFSISTDTLVEEQRIRNTDITSYRLYLLANNSVTLPQIIGIESKFDSCSNGKYSTFYHYNVECEWLCDHVSLYNNFTNECESIVSVSSIRYITETNTKRFIGIGYFGSLIITICCCMIYRLYVKQKRANNALKKQSKPVYKRKESFYFYNDTENDESAKETKKSEDNLDAEHEAEAQAAVGNEAVNVDLSALQSPNTQNEEIFREGTLGVLENMECDEKFKRMKSMMIDEARLKQFKILDNMEEIIVNIDDEIHEQNMKQRTKLKSEYLISVKKVMENSEMNEIEKQNKLADIEKTYNETKNKLDKEVNDDKNNKINDYKQKTKEEIMNIKSETTQKISDLIKDDDNQSN